MVLRKLKPLQARASAARAGSVAEASARSLVPSASELGEVFLGASKSAMTPVAGQKANVLLSVLQYNDEAGIYGTTFSDGDMKVIHCLHEQKPFVFFQFWR